MDSLLIGIFFTIMGAIYLGAPDLMIAFRKWSTRRFMKMEFQPTPATRVVYRVIGSIILVLGLINLYNSLKGSGVI